MKLLKLFIRNGTGLHARPAKTFVQLAKEYKSEVKIAHGKKKANAKSMLAVLGLGVPPGGKIRVRIEGEDEEEAALAIETAVRSGLGETEHLLPEIATDAQEDKPKVPPKPKVVTKPTAASNGVNGSGGTPAAPGIAIGAVFQLIREEIVIQESFSSGEAEHTRLKNAFQAAREQLNNLRDQMDPSASEEAAIFDVHLELMDDPDLQEVLDEQIDTYQKSAAHAWKQTIEERATAIAQLDNPTLAARAADLQDVGDRVLRALLGLEPEKVAWPDHPVIVIADDLTPSDTAALDPDRVLGFCTAAGGPTSHSAIIARALGLPAVVSAGEKVLNLSNGTPLILNGQTGAIIIDPDKDVLTKMQEAQAREQARRLAAVELAGEPALTKDGHHVEVAANIGGPDDARDAHAAGAEGVGLLRSEFLFLDRANAPTEDEQYGVYSEIAGALQNKPVILRTLDIGGDKPLSYIDVPHEENPFLGERGLRLCLNRPELLRQQVRAALRATDSGVLRMMFPMVADVSEWRAARAIVEEIRQELNAPQIELGIMIEIPSAALMADAFADEVDFFSVGTNDLTQYTLAVDRLHPGLSHLSDGLHPAVLRLIDHTVKAAHKAGKWVGICGALGADPQAIPILVGLEVDELSVAVPTVATTKALIRELTLPKAKEIAAKALQCSTAAEVRSLVPLVS